MANRPKAVFVNPDDSAATSEQIEELAAEREEISRDIAVRVARVMLNSALMTEVCELGELDGLSLVMLPSMEWARPVRDAIKLGARGGKGPTTVRAGQPAPLRAEPGWAFVEISGRVGCEAPARIAIALSQGLSVVAVAAAADRERLPLGLEGAADRVLVLQPPSWVGLAAAAMEGRQIERVDWNSVRHDEALLDGLTPSILGMCYRHGQRVQAFCSRLASALKFAAKRKLASSGPRGLARVPGLSPAVNDWVHSLVRDFADYREGRIGWAEVDRGAVIAGPPGCGKTTLARAMAEEMGVPLILGSQAQWQSCGHQGDMLKAMRGTFAEARQAAPCLLFLDELDAFSDRRKLSGDNAEYCRQVTNALLAELDGAVGRDGVVVIGACNHADLLEPALTRPGRLERVLALGPPDRDVMEAVLRVHLGGELKHEALADVAVLAHGMTGAEAEAAVRDAKRAARVLGRPLRRGDLLLAICEARGIELVAHAALIH
ncbi:ATP-binding protein [Roseococcus sp. SDR]|uniref:ATP-binding protein n=1 Tax=Roseococcus sp. SDR TaxID=2835532 RepID=UPI001BCC3DAC|nr:ATP-binding protein [Roseococcus sp. SDR]MBS7792451.1 ATP-binding protein [Roseococcus sp. SDR]MBV1847765.1 ATP-binding protein [Roseococcus sp. SDR]